ncbi:MAG TPA: homoserine kinase [Candidatus Methylomirabilis sp.]|nr:homoserine kinase [Candidatus Methylomirabilis sp.]HSB80966.1 homoserine kinase [Candidatus Methylomirabilis sp.]
MSDRRFVRLRVPASTANLGPGFDALGMALGLYNEIEVEVTGIGLRLEVEGEGAERLLSLGRQNLVARAVTGTLERLGRPVEGIRVRMLNRIPLSRGLGSSSAAALGGVAAAAELAGASLTPEALLDLALPLEGHPDNITPALLGGLTVATVVDGRVRCVKLPVPEGLSAVAVIPEFHLSTAKARRALPPTVPRADAVFNVGRVALLLAAMQSGRLDLLREAVRDRLHQPYRAPLVPGMDAVLAEGEAAGALGCFLSGAGPTLLALTTGDGAAIGERMTRRWMQQASVTARVLSLPIDREGLRVEE